MRVLLVCEEQITPPFIRSGGSSPVYAGCLEALAEVYQTSFLGFDRPGIPDEYLRGIARRHLILPGPNRSKALTLAQAVAKSACGSLEAPPWLEEFGRRDIKRRIRAFIDRVQPEVLMVHLTPCIRWVGQDIIRGFSGIKVIDMHDDFVLREYSERIAMANIMVEYPVMRSYARYSDLARKHLFLRFSLEGARAHELKALSLFDGILCSNLEDSSTYQSLLPDKTVIFSPWPVMAKAIPVQKGSERYDLGFIASDHPFQFEGIAHFIKNVLPGMGCTLAVAGGVCEPLSIAFPDLMVRGVTLLGRIPAVEDFYIQVRVVVVPLLSGTGVSVKTLEAMAFGREVVSTKVGVRGIAPSDLRAVTVCSMSEMAKISIEAVEALRHGSPRMADHPMPSSDRNVRRYQRNIEVVFNSIIRSKLTGSAQNEVDGEPDPGSDRVIPPGGVPFSAVPDHPR